MLKQEMLWKINIQGYKSFTVLMSERGGGFFLRLCASEFSEFFEGANKLCDEAIFVIVPGDRFHQL